MICYNLRVQIKVSDSSPSLTIAVNTIGLAIDSHNPDRTFLLHCAYCGRELFQAQGKLARFVPWFEPTTNPSMLYRCARCSQYMTVQTVPYRKSVFVRFTNRQYFHCLICHLQFDGSECPRCHTSYDFHEAV